MADGCKKPALVGTIGIPAASLAEIVALPASGSVAPDSLRLPPSSHSYETRIVALEAELLVANGQDACLGLILDSATDYAIITADVTGRKTRWNVGAQAVTGYTEAELLGRCRT